MSYVLYKWQAQSTLDGETTEAHWHWYCERASEIEIRRKVLELAKAATWGEVRLVYPGGKTFEDMDLHEWRYNGGSSVELQEELQGLFVDLVMQGSDIEEAKLACDREQRRRYGLP